MARFSHVIAVAAAVLGLAACGGASAPSPLAAAASPLPAAPEELSVIVDRYWDESARGESRLGGGISPQFLADSLALERRSLAEILMLPRARLDADAALTFDIFKRERELAIEGAVYPAELLPVNGFSDLPQQFAAMGAGSGSQAFSSARDYENWLARIDDYAAWTDQALFNMREGLRRGYTMPRVIVKRALPVLAKLAEDNSANPFYRPLAMPETLHDPERSSLNSRLNAAIKGKVLPSYRALHDFLQAEYLPRARDSVGLSALPLGQSWYAYLVRSQTDAAATPADIHRQGLAEVERIRGRIQALSPEAPNGAAMQHSAGPDELLAALNDLKSKVTAAAPALFDPIPPADLEIRSAGFGPPRPLLSYLAASDAPRAAILYVNTSAYAEYSTGAVQSLFLQEGIPGRHYQIGLQRALTGIPKFRRFGTDPAFVEGWCLYAASLGEELGVYRDAEAKLEALLHQLRAAVGVVIDTGLHSQGWSRQQALEYLHAQLPMDDAVAAAAVDRTIALPGQALAAEAGALKIQALRARSQQELGARFDIRAFHAEVLKDGSMPLDLLEAKIQRWLAAAH